MTFLLIILPIMIEEETGTLEDPRFKFSTEPRHFTFMGRPHVAHYPKCTQIYNKYASHSCPNWYVIWSKRTQQESLNNLSDIRNK